MLTYFTQMMSVYWNRLKILREEEAGMTTETVIITGLLAAAAFGALYIIVRAITNRANNSADTIEGG
jgi:hypothetical protein